jgi:hypothetical protein
MKEVADGGTHPPDPTKEGAMINEETIELKANNEEISELTSEEAAKVQGGGLWSWLFGSKSYVTGTRTTTTYRA